MKSATASLAIRLSRWRRDPRPGSRGDAGISRCLTCLLCLAGLSAGCASSPRVMTWFPEHETAEHRTVWPAPPETARLAYAGELIGERNFRRADGRQDGGAVRLLRWIVGLGGARDRVTELARPQSGVVDDRGRILVTDAGRQAVLVFDEAGARLSDWTEAAAGRSFQAPVGIVSRGADDILVADAELGYVVKLSAEGAAVGTLGRDMLQRPTGLAYDPLAREVYVADSAAHDIKVFDSGDELVRTLGQRGTAPGEFNGPTHLAYAQGKLYVTDTLNARVQVIDRDGQPVSSVGQLGLYVGNLVRPKGVTTDRDGNIYVIESYYDHLLIFREDGELLLPLGGTGGGVGEFFLPAGAWSDGGNRLFVADMFNGRVIVLDYLGDAG